MNTADGFGLLNSLRTQENHEGLLIDTLEQRREKLACAILGDYPTFKSSVKKLIMDWNKALQMGWIGQHEVWPVRLIRSFIGDRLFHLFGDRLNDWIHAAGNIAATIETTLQHVTSLFTSEMRKVTLMRQNSSVPLSNMHYQQMHHDNSARSDRHVHWRDEQSSHNRSASRGRSRSRERDYRDDSRGRSRSRDRSDSRDQGRSVSSERPYTGFTSLAVMASKLLKWESALLTSPLSAPMASMLNGKSPIPCSIPYRPRTFFARTCFISTLMAPKLATTVQFC